MRKLLFAATLMLALSGPTKAASACSDTVNSYNSAVDEISYALKRYAGCVQNSNGADDCSSEFRRLKNAQDEFESAVSEYQSECQ